jgi:hypothetical protein
MGRAAWIVVLLAAVFAGCGGEATTPASGTDGVAPGTDEPRFPDVLEVVIEPLGGEEYRVAVTVSSPYDSPDRYADAWRVLDPDGDELGVRELTHDHAAEQPFTRDTTVQIPLGVAEVTVEGRDLVNGYGGSTVTVAVPPSTPG